MILEILFLIFLLVLTIKNVLYVKNVFLSKRYLNSQDPTWEAKHTRSVLLMIPVLHEQRVIIKTLEKMSEFIVGQNELTIVIVGTSREQKGVFPWVAKSTGVIVEEWISEAVKLRRVPRGFSFHYTKANDPDGDRATQLNHGIRYYREHLQKEFDIVGVYDADSSPDVETIIEVIKVFEKGYDCCQQPVHFIDAAEEGLSTGKNPLIIASALYQTTWTAIRELPVWYRYSVHRKRHPKTSFKRNIYLIGHGEFLSQRLLKEFGFPENEITDGIQLGYRLGMSHEAISPVRVMCSDGVPKNIPEMIQQHKRWFAGCMRLGIAYGYTRKTGKPSGIYQCLNGLWSQLMWAFAAPICTVMCLSLFFVDDPPVRWVLGMWLLANLACYCYALPIMTHWVLRFPKGLKPLHVLILPFAIALKAIGPNVYMGERLLSVLGRKRGVSFKKVER